MLAAVNVEVSRCEIRPALFYTDVAFPYSGYLSGQHREQIFLDIVSQPDDRSNSKRPSSNTGNNRHKLDPSLASLPSPVSLS